MGVTSGLFQDSFKGPYGKLVGSILSKARRCQLKECKLSVEGDNVVVLSGTNGSFRETYYFNRAEWNSKVTKLTSGSLEWVKTFEYPTEGYPRHRICYLSPRDVLALKAKEFQVPEDLIKDGMPGTLKL